jgi:hypothetical protein
METRCTFALPVSAATIVAATAMNETLSIEKNALYYAVTAQLQGGGDIMCKIQIGDAVRVGHARGGYNICSAQLNSDPINGGWG